jgi:hypothetical protein
MFSTVITSADTQESIFRMQNSGARSQNILDFGLRISDCGLRIADLQRHGARFFTSPPEIEVIT